MPKFESIQSMSCLCLALVVTLTGSHAVAADGDFELRRSVIAAGGGLSSGGDFALTGSMGQPEAGDAMAGGNFSHTGGFFSPGAVMERPPQVFRDGFED